MKIKILKAVVFMLAIWCLMWTWNVQKVSWWQALLGTALLLVIRYISIDGSKNWIR